MVCPAVNAYASVEPGVLTPFLSEMNNFVPYGGTCYDYNGDNGGVGGPYDSSDMETEVASSSREDESPTGSRFTSEGTNKKTNKIQHHHHHQPNHHHHHYSPNPSSLSTSTSSRHSSNEGHHSSSQGESQPSQQQQIHGQQQQKRGQKRRAEDSFSTPPTTHNNNNNNALKNVKKRPFVESLALRPEHYRAVTPRTPHRNTSSSSSSSRRQYNERRDDDDAVAVGTNDNDEDSSNNNSYEYQHVPLTFAGRKRLTDTLFYFCRTHLPPSVTADVAALLRMAREKNEWDVAVSEVMTQVVVCIHCSEGDYQLDGLRHYLLKIGISS